MRRKAGLAARNRSWGLPSLTTAYRTPRVWSMASFRSSTVEQTVGDERHPTLNRLPVLHRQEGVESLRRRQPPHPVVHRMRSNPVVGEHAILAVLRHGPVSVIVHTP